jgi:hypothetical protein
MVLIFFFSCFFFFCLCALFKKLFLSLTYFKQQFSAFDVHHHNLRMLSSPHEDSLYPLTLTPTFCPHPLQCGQNSHTHLLSPYGFVYSGIFMRVEPSYGWFFVTDVTHLV